MRRVTRIPLAGSTCEIEFWSVMAITAACTSGKYLEVHHWQPLPHENDGIDRRGYNRTGNPNIVPESGLITLCQTQ